MKSRPQFYNVLWRSSILLGMSCIAAFSLGAERNEKSHRDRFAMQEAKLEAAKQEASSRLTTNPKDFKARLDLGLAYLGQGQIDAAVEEIRQAVQAAPSSSDAQAHLAYALWMQGSLDKAIVAARSSLKLNEENSLAHRYLGRLLLLTRGDNTEAIENLERAVQSNPRESDIHFDLLMAYRAASDAESAWAELRMLRAEYEKDSPRVLYMEGLLASDQGRATIAIDRFRRALDGDPRLSEARESLGVALAESQRWPEAIEVLESALKKNPRSFRLVYAHALALLNIHRLPEADDEARKALRLNPQSAEAHALLEEVLAGSSRLGVRRP